MNSEEKLMNIVFLIKTIQEYTLRPRRRRSGSGPVPVPHACGLVRSCTTPARRGTNTMHHSCTQVALRKRGVRCRVLGRESTELRRIASGETSRARLGRLGPRLSRQRARASA